MALPAGLTPTLLLSCPPVLALQYFETYEKEKQQAPGSLF